MNKRAIPTSFSRQPTTMARKDKALATIKAAATRMVHQTEQGLGAICPVSGLFQPLGMPALPGMVLSAHHPICFNALAILNKPEYCASLDAEHSVALILASLAALDKLALTGSAAAINIAMQAALSPAQLSTILSFIRDKMLTTKRHYPKLEIKPSSSMETTLLGYMSRCIAVENARLITEAPATTKAEIPKFLSSSVQGKTLDADCYEAWLELAPLLPATLKDKARPYIKQLATIAQSTLIEKLVTACAANLQGITAEDCIEYSEFKLAVTEARRKAEALGLYRSLLDDEPLLTPAPASAPAPAPEAAPAPSPVQLPSRIAAKLAAARAARETNNA